MGGSVPSQVPPGYSLNVRAHLVAGAADDAAYDILDCAGGGVDVGLEGGRVVVVVVGRHGGG